MKFPFVPSPQYTAIALAYQNPELIADQVLPRTPVTERSFKWDLYTKAEAFTVPNTLVGRKGSVNEIEFTATEQSASVADYGLGFVVPQDDIDSAASKPGLDPIGRHTEGTTNLVLLDREIRVANLVFAAGTYPTGSKVQLSGNDQWSAYSQSASDPIEDILTAKEGMLMAPNTFVMGSQVLFYLERHPRIIAAVFPLGGNAASGGIATLDQLERLFGMRILVGRAYANSAKPGQAASLGRVWGKHAAMLRLGQFRGVQGTDISFGVTAEYNSRVAYTRPDPDIGLRGGTRGKVGETLKELITAADCGYFFQDVVA